ncbi:MAG: methyltransferase [Dehalococcoidia bacterium]
MVTNSNEEYSFSAFSSLPFYTGINSRLLDLAEVGKQRRIIDLGCGTGGVTKLILDRLQAARETVIYAIDHSSIALRAAVTDLGDRRDAAVRFVQAEVQQLSDAVREQVDAIVYCNSIHYVPDKEQLLRQIRVKLEPGGILAFNTSFFEGSHPPESHEFYRRWMMKSLRILKRDHGIMPDKSKKVEARVQLTPEEYESLLERSGFRVVKQEIAQVEVPISGWHHISGFSDWIEGIMPGVPLDKGRESLQKGLEEVWSDMNLETVPRRWMSVSAART